MHNYFIGELLGTMTLVMFGCGAVATALLRKSKGEGGGWICITLGWGLAVAFGVFVAQASGSIQADINPAVTIAKYFLNIYQDLSEVFNRIIAEFIGAFIGAVIVWLAYLSHWKATEDQRFKLMVFCTSPEIPHKFNNLLTEIVGAFALVLGIGAIVNDKQILAGISPYYVGLLVVVIGLAFGGPTGYAINPARDLSPRLAHAILPIAGKGKSEWHYAWIPVVGPIIGALVGAIVWKLFL
jgi:glycerol uptake facilitator protein